MVKLTDIELPMIFKDKLLFSSGFHNDLSIAREEIEKSFLLTDWSDQRNRSLFLSHSERDAESWLGRIINPYMKNGELFGDLEVHDANLALKLGPGRAPIGVSAEIRWPPQHLNPIDFTYRGFAMVPNPEVPDTLINFSKKEKDGFNTAQIIVISKDIESHAEFSESAVGETSDFENHKHTYAVNDMGNGNTTGGFTLGPVKEAVTHKHMISEYNVQVSFEHKHEIAKRANNSEAEFSGVVTSETAKGSPMEEENKEEAEADFSEEKESNLMSAERGFNEEKMENTEENVKNVEEEKVEETTKVETKTEEVKEETAPAEDAKADFSKIDAKLDTLSERMTKMEANIAKFSEAEEAKEEEVAEEVEAAPAEEATEEVAKEEVVVEEVVEEGEKAEEVAEVAEEATEEAEDAKAEFSGIADKLDKLADAIANKDAVSMSTAEFGNKGLDKEIAVIDRLTESLSN